jgi:hypothetical protein
MGRADGVGITHIVWFSEESLQFEAGFLGAILVANPYFPLARSGSWFDVGRDLLGKQVSDERLGLSLVG